MKNYYKILDLPPTATEEEIRRAYRRLALRHHPDRNPGDAGAEERFKEIAEAYGVLTDPAKRSHFDRHRTTRSGPRPAEGFRYSQEEIFRDLFRDPRFNQMFQELYREFERAGFRFDERFFKQMFFGDRGGFGGLFVWTPFGGLRALRPGRPPSRPAPARQAIPFWPPLKTLRKWGRQLKRLLLGGPRVLPGSKAPGGLDLLFDLPVSPEAARAGGWVQIAIPRTTGTETLKVRLPPASGEGTRLRLKGKGRRQEGGAGDLYLTIRLAQGSG